MTDWKEKLEAEYRAKRKEGEEEAQRRHAHDKFVESEGWIAWQELHQKVEEACRHLTAHAGARLTCLRDEGEAFIVAGGANPLDVSLDVPTRKVKWSVRGSTSQGFLRPDRERDELVYRDNGNTVGSVEDAATFLLRKVF